MDRCERIGDYIPSNTKLDSQFVDNTLKVDNGEQPGSNSSTRDQRERHDPEQRGRVLHRRRREVRRDWVSQARHCAKVKSYFEPMDRSWYSILEVGGSGRREMLAR